MHAKIKGQSCFAKSAFKRQALHGDSALLEATAGAIQNYMVRTRGGWEHHFLSVPNFTVGSVSPGLQAADVIAYLGARLASGQDRPELQPYIERMRGLTYEFTRPGRSARRTRTARRRQQNKELASPKALRSHFFSSDGMMV